MYQGKLGITKTSLVDQKLTENQIEQITCLICLDIATLPVSCTVCKSKYCLACANMWKAKYNSCPKKCQAPWLLDVHKSSGVLLRCPYDSECPRSTPENLTSHLSVCKSAPESVKRQFVLRKNYLCEKEHLLEFWLTTFEDMINAKCFECGENINSRSVCHKCKVKYCVNCRPPPCSKSKCPNGHGYIKNKPSPYLTYICDVCGLQIGPICEDIFDDVKCNFGVCGNCIHNLPEIQEVKAAQNRYQECRKGHTLSYLAEVKTGVCAHCEYNRQLDRICDKCEERYCMECKPMKVRSNNTCIKRHKLQFSQQDIAPGVCRICKEPEVFAVDEECHIKLCSECYTNLKMDTDNLERLIGQQCAHPEKHSLMEFKNKATCCQCKRQVYCPLKCGPCGTFFCMKCRPSKHPKEDYIGHPYNYTIDAGAEPRECVSCGQKFDKILECDICDLSICVACHDKL